MAKSKNSQPLKNTVSDLRKKAGLTQQIAATALGIRKETLSDWENGKAVPNVLMVPKLSELYNASIDDVVSSFVEVHRQKSFPVPESEDGM